MALVNLLILAPEIGAQQADDPGPLVTDRPDFTESAVTVPVGRVQIEGGSTWSRAGEENAHSLGDLLVRWAFLRGIEARFGLNSFVIAERPDTDVEGLSDMSIGAKLDAVKLLGWPRSSELSLIVSSAFPSGSSETGTRDWQPAGTLSFAIDLSDRVTLGSNAGLRFPVGDGRRFVEGALSAALGYGLSHRWGLYGEAYAILPEGSRPDELFVNGGVTYRTSDDFQLDARIGSMVAGSTWPNLFAGIGAAWRI